MRTRQRSRQTNYVKRTGMIQSANSAYYLSITSRASGLTAAVVQMFRRPETPDRVLTMVTPHALRGASLNHTLGAYLQGIILGQRLLRMDLEFQRIFLYTPRRIHIGSRAHALIQGVTCELGTQEGAPLEFRHRFSEWSLQRYLQRSNHSFTQDQVGSFLEQINNLVR